jgi:hypothetical protein
MADIGELDTYFRCGRGVLMNKAQQCWQNVDSVLGLFSRQAREARKRNREFVEQANFLGKRPDHVGGGLLRSFGGWAGLLRKSDWICCYPGVHAGRQEKMGSG